jgi:DNA/RNA non-specific endonuclease
MRFSILLSVALTGTLFSCSKTGIAAFPNSPTVVEGGGSNEQLIKDSGGTGRLIASLLNHTENENKILLEKYGLKYSQYTPQKAKTASGELSALDLYECVAIFPPEDRQKWTRVDNTVVFIDKEGRPEIAGTIFAPSFPPAPRDANCQRIVGNFMGQFYDGGHLVGSQLGGFGGRANLVPQDSNFNRGNWLQIEKAVKSCDNTSLPPGQALEKSVYYARVVYFNESKELSLLPSRMIAGLGLNVGTSREFNGEWGFRNVSIGGPNGPKTRENFVNFLKNRGCGS